jgi:hypothetical protein
MGSKWKDRPIFVGLDDVLIEDEAQDSHRVQEPLSSSSNWPSMPQHEPSKSRFDKPSDYTSTFKYSEARIHDYSASYLPSTTQQEASRQKEDERYKYNFYHERFPRNSLISHRSQASQKCTTEGHAMPSQNRARHVDPPSRHEQGVAEETARDVLGPCFIDCPTVQFILKFQATRMDPMEWVSVKEVIQREPEAGKSLLLLTYLLDKEGKASEDRQAVLRAQEMSIREWWEAKRKLDTWPGLRRV